MAVVAFSDSVMLYANVHLSAADRFSNMVATEENGPKDHDAIREYATGCIFVAVAALEAYANELFSQPQMMFPEHSPEVVGEKWKRFEKGRLLDKFNFALQLKGKPSLDEKAPPTEDVALLIALRNALVHFKPEWQSKAVHHPALSERLGKKFEPSKIIEGPMFPNSWHTFGCTSWAVNTVRDFTRHFAQLGRTFPRF